MFGTVDLFTIVRAVTHQSWSRRHPLDIRHIAHDIACLRQYGRHFWRDHRLGARAQPDNFQPATHGLLPLPWISRMEKYGTLPLTSVNGTTRSWGMAA